MLEALVTLAFLGMARLIAYVRYVNARPERPFGVNDLHETTGSLDMQITKVRSQLFIRLEQVAVHLRRAQNTLSALGESVAERTLRLQGAVRARKNGLRKLLASSLDTIRRTNGTITKFGSELFLKVQVWLRRAQNTLSALGESVAERTLRLQGAVRARKNGLRKLLASSLDTIRRTNGTITKFGSELFLKLQVRLRRAQNTLSALGESVAEKPRRLQEALRDRENGLRKLLASSPDAIVVTNGDHRFVAANPNALQLFGVTETNIRQFTIDAFLPGGQILDFDANGLPFMKREERHGKCKIRRLDGSVRVAEYVFVANFVPLRHLSRFHDVTPGKMKFMRATVIKRAKVSSKTASQNRIAPHDGEQLSLLRCR
jgi:PAS domain S-box-containing protein